LKDILTNKNCFQVAVALGAHEDAKFHELPEFSRIIFGLVSSRESYLTRYVAHRGPDNSHEFV